MTNEFNIANLNNAQMDVLKEIGNIGSGNAITALSKILLRKIGMDIPEIKILKINEICEILGGEEITVIGIVLNISGDISGEMLFILKLDAAQKLLDVIMKNYEDRNRTESDLYKFNEIELSALKEVGNILASVYLSAISTLTKLKIVPSIPDIACDMAGAILSVPAIEAGQYGDYVLYIASQFKDGTAKLEGDFFLIPYSDSYSILLRALGV